MKFFKTINLTAYEVEYIDQREPKPRTVKHEAVVLDGGRISALGRLGIRPGSPSSSRPRATPLPPCARARVWAQM